MKDEANSLLDDLLLSWFNWSQGFQPVASHGTSAMFTGVRSNRQYDSENDVTDSALHNEQMKAIDFHITELCDVYRTALGICARNLRTGKSVWKSARLPESVEGRVLILCQARTSLLLRLRDAGII